MGKTNLDDLDLAVPGIEADEINSEGAAAGRVLTADGLGGADWADGGAAAVDVAGLKIGHNTEDQFDSGTWYVSNNGYLDFVDTGFTYDAPSGEITIGSELDGRLALVIARSGLWNPSQDGQYGLAVQIYQGGSWTNYHDTAVEVDSAWDGRTVVQSVGIYRLVAGEKYRVRLLYSAAAAATAEWVLDEGSTQILAF